MFQKKVSLKKEVSKITIKPYSRAYMSSYDWTYTVLDIVDFIEINLSSKKEGDDGWKLFQDYCVKNNLNWRVIRKMIGFTVAEKFNSEEELIQCEDFKPLELRQDRIIEDTNNKEEKVFNFSEEDLAFLNNTEDIKTTKKKYAEEKTIDISF